MSNIEAGAKTIELLSSVCSIFKEGPPNVMEYDVTGSEVPWAKWIWI